jgi:hypothetical protein
MPVARTSVKIAARSWSTALTKVLRERIAIYLRRFQGAVE